MTEQDQDTCMIRAFVAAAVDDSLKHSFELLQSELSTTGAHVRWVRPHNIHLTLVFLGDIPESSVAAISNELDRAAHDTAPCDLEVCGLGFFGSSRAPRVIWAGLQGDIDRVKSIQQQVTCGVLAAGFRTDTKPFKPHLTLGRVRSARNAKSLVSAVTSRKDMPFGRLTIQNIILMKSRLTPDGPVYSILHHARLGEEDDG